MPFNPAFPRASVLVLGLLSAGAGSAFAAENASSTGNNAWMLTSTALVLFMTIPGLALFLRRLGEPAQCPQRAHAMLRPDRAPQHRLVDSGV